MVQQFLGAILVLLSAVQFRIQLLALFPRLRLSSPVRLRLLVL
jgi:hypothetical protein